MKTLELYINLEHLHIYNNELLCNSNKINKTLDHNLTEMILATIAATGGMHYRFNKHLRRAKIHLWNINTIRKFNMGKWPTSHNFIVRGITTFICFQKK